jgi:putative ABC transport system permease protein
MGACIAMRSTGAEPRDLAMRIALLPRFRTSWAQVRSAPGRVASTVVAVALGVALASGILLVAEELPAALEASVEAVVGRADLQVVARSGAGLDEALLPRIAAVPGVAVAAPVVTVPSFFDDDTSEQVTIWGVDLLNESALRLYGMAPGGGGGGRVDLDDPLVFASRPDSAIAPPGLLERRGLRKGDAVRLATPAGARSLVVRGVFSGEDSRRNRSTGILVMDVYSAQLLFDMAGRFTHVDVLLEPGASHAAVRDRIASVLAGAASVVAAGAHNTTARSMLEGARLIIRAMSLSGILLAALLTYNRLSTIFFARRWEVGVSRALGASPRVATLELLKEALLVGTIGALVGTAAAWGIAYAMEGVVSRVAEVVMSVAMPELHVGLRPGALAFGALLGILATVAGALSPARQAGRAPVASVLRGRGLDATTPLDAAGVHRSSSRRWAVPVVLATACAILLWVESRTHAAAGGFAAIALAIFAVASLARPLLELLVGPWTPVMARLAGPVGRIAMRDLARSAQRSAGSVRLIAVGLGIVLWFQMLATSFETSNARLMAGSRHADLIVASAYDVGSETALLSETILDELRRIPGVAAVGGERGLFGADFGLSAFDAAQLRDPRLTAWTAARPISEEALAHVAAGRAVLVTPGFSVHHGVGVGDDVVLPSPTGPVRLPVAGLATASVYSNKGDVLIAREAYRRSWRDSAITRAHLALEPGHAVAEVRGRILRALGERHRLRLLTKDELVDHYKGVVRDAAALLHPMSLIAGVVVVLGIADALLATVLDRTRELGMMRALGASPQTVGRFVLVQAVVLCTLGALLAPLLALALGFALLDVTSISVIGWPVETAIAPGAAVLVLAAALAAALAGAALPAWRATRIAPADALRAE